MHEVDNNNNKNNNKNNGGGGGCGGGRGGRRHPYEGIRHLKIYGDMIDPMKMMEDLRPCFEVLESLRIEIMCPSHRNIDIFTILDNGPRLKSMEIVNPREYGTVSILQGGGAGTTIEPGRQKHYPLEQLTLDGPWMDFKTTEQILMSCPAVRVLKSSKISYNEDRWALKLWDPTVVQEASDVLPVLLEIVAPTCNGTMQTSGSGPTSLDHPAMST